MHKPLAQALVMIAAAAVASDEPSSGRRLAARRGRRRPVKRETESRHGLHADGARHTIREGGPLPNACAGASKVRVECGGLCGWCYFKSLRVTTIIH